ncbi:hypothetical protein RRG08_016642 [Elysia crispata]|uniref:Uncharacterized protein n=1 Tax=Elysia crispata TaxID=231223 RepID=A0AAE0YX14_9GAST|nr:hypothetical protein RRG08_016642 [Elysia crispata]
MVGGLYPSQARRCCAGLYAQFPVLKLIPGPTWLPQSGTGCSDIASNTDPVENIIIADCIGSWAGSCGSCSTKNNNIKHTNIKKRQQVQ